MTAIRFLTWPLRLLVSTLAMLGAMFLIVFILGSVFTYLSWIIAEGIFTWALPALIMALAAFAVVRLWERKRTEALPPLSQTELIWTGRRKRPRTLAIWVAMTVAVLGATGHAIYEVRRMTVWSLEPGGNAAVPLLIHLAGRDDRALQEPALEILTKLGPKASEASAWLIEHAKPMGGNLDGDQVTKAIKSIGGKSPELLVNKLTDGDPATRSWAARILQELPPGQDAVPLLLTIVKDNDSDSRLYALDVLSRMGADAMAAVPVLLDRIKLRHSDNEEFTVIKILAKSGEAGAQYVPDLAKTVFDSNYPLQFVKVFVAIGPKVVDPLLNLAKLTTDRPGVAYAIIDSLAAIDPDSPATLELLRGALRGPVQLMQIHAAAAMIRVGLDAEEAFAVLDAALQDKVRGIRDNARYTVGELGPQAAPLLKRYREWLSSPEETTQLNGLHLIGKLKGAGTPAVSWIADYLRSAQEPGQQSAALETLRQIGPSAASAESAIRETMPRFDMPTQLLAGVALVEIAGKADGLADVVLRNDKRQLEQVRHYRLEDEITRAVLKLGPNARPLVPAIDKLYALGMMQRHSYKELLTAIDPWLWRMRNPDTIAWAILFVMGLCLLFKIGEIIWWRSKHKRQTALSKAN